MWQLTRHCYSSDFAGFLDQVMAEAPSHEKSTYKRWKELVASNQSLPKPRNQTTKKLMGTDVRFWPIADIPSCTVNVRFWGQSGHDACIAKCLLMTQSGHWLCTAAMNADFNPYQSTRLIGTILVLRLGGGHETARVNCAMSAIGTKRIIAPHLFAIGVTADIWILAQDGLSTNDPNELWQAVQWRV